MWRCRSSLETDRFMASTLWFDFERISDVHTGSERAVLEIIGTPLVANSHLFSLCVPSPVATVQETKWNAQKEKACINTYAHASKTCREAAKFSDG